MRNGMNVMEYFKPSELMRVRYYLLSDTGILGKNTSVPIPSILIHGHAQNQETHPLSMKH